MGKSIRLTTLASAVSLALAGASAILPAHDANAANSASIQRDNSDVRTMYIVRFEEAGLMHYAGGVQGLAPTAAAGDSRKVDVRSPAAVAYAGYLAAQRDAHVADINAAIGRSIDVPNSYAVTMNGIATEMTAGEARHVAGLPGVADVRLAGTYQLDTYRGPGFIHADDIWSGVATPTHVGTKGEGVVVGVIDTGAFAAHPSFANDAACGFSSANPKQLSAADCSTSSGGVCTGPNPEANPGNGHGVHTASTAAGNTLTSATVPPPVIPAPYTSMSGVAPCAKLRTYKVCETDTCAGNMIVAGIENAIADGVDVINFSISGGKTPWVDNDRLFLDAVGADIFVAASAGNTRATTPNPVGQVNHLGPWVTTVAASTHDKNVAGTGLLSVTGPGTPPANTTNIAMTPGSGLDVGVAGNLPIRRDASNVEGCTAFPANYFQNAIALISRGTCSFEIKVQNAAAAGASVAVIYNNAAGAINMNVGAATLPAYSILQAQGQAIANFITANGATPTLADFAPAAQQADVLGGFSLRGPSSLVTATKPDITAPGVNIYAAVTNGAPENYYGYISGTSMSSPHVAGAAALIRAVKPDWTPSEVKSALMTTAFGGGHKENLTTPWDADDVGSGRADLSKAALAGLTLDETYANYLAANPAGGSIDVKDLNVPSMRNVNCVETCTWKRTVRNRLSGSGNWSATFETGSTEFDVAVTPASFTLAAGATQELTITATPKPNVTMTGIGFGNVVLKEAGGQSPDQHLTVALKGNGAVVVDDTIFKDGFDGEAVVGFSENFDAYAANGNVHGQGGWKGWGNDAAAGATVVTTQSVSAPNSIEIKGDSDLIHEFSQFTSGSWTITAKQYIPTAFSGKTYFIFENVYSDTDTSIISWSTQVYFDSATGQVSNETGAANPGTATLVKGQWVDLKLVVDLDNDLQTFWYNGTQLYSGSWKDQFPGQDVPGIAAIGSIDLFADGASAVYYDDIRIVPTTP